MYQNKTQVTRNPQRFKFKLSYWQCRDLIQTLCRYDAKLRARRICDQFAISH